MTAPTKAGSDGGRALPRPIVERRWWPILFIWLVPVLAAILAGYYFRDRLADLGPLIAVQFKDGSGLRAGETPVSYRGVQIGKVTDVQLGADRRHVVVQVRLRRSANSFVREGTVFWIVRPEISAATINGLDIIFSGPYIEAQPGDGPPAKEFKGLDREPVAAGEGLRVVLHAPRLENLQPGSPVYFRGIQVGVIEDVQIGRDASRVDLRVFVGRRYRGLVRPSSQFWIVSGAEVRGGMFTAIRVKVESLRSLLLGGVEFATPEIDPGEPARDGDAYLLHDAPKKEWLKWATMIAVPAEESE